MNILNKKIVFVVLSLFLLSLILSIIFPKFPAVIIFKTFKYAAYNFENVSGLSPWLIKGILVFALFPFYWALLELFKIKIPFLKSNKSSRKIAKTIVLTYTGLFFLAMFFLSRGTYFGHFKGEAIKYYAVTPEGTRYFDSPGFDPKYGIELKPVTPDMVMKFQKKEMGMQPKRIDVENNKHVEFFDPITGEAKVWYYQDSNENYEFFDGPGFHSIYKVELKPVSPEIIQSYQKRLKDKQEEIDANHKELIKKEIQEKQNLLFNKYMNMSVVNLPGTKDLAILIVDESEIENNETEDYIASKIRSGTTNPVLGLFKRPFVKEGFFNRIFSGDATAIKELKLENRVDLLVFGKIKKDIVKREELQDLISTNMTIELKIYSCVKGSLTSSAFLKATGAGFSNVEAEGNAFEQMKEKLDGFLKKNL